MSLAVAINGNDWNLSGVIDPCIIHLRPHVTIVGNDDAEGRVFDWDKSMLRPTAMVLTITLRRRVVVTLLGQKTDAGLKDCQPSKDNATFDSLCLHNM